MNDELRNRIIKRIEEQILKHSRPLTPEEIKESKNRELLNEDFDLDRLSEILYNGVMSQLGIEKDGDDENFVTVTLPPGYKP